MASLLVEKGMKLESTLDFSRVTAEIRRVWLRIVLFVVLVSALALPFIIGMTPVYQASATMLFRAEAENVSPVENVYRFDSTRKEYYDTQFQILQSRRIAEQVVDKLGLAALPEFTSGAKGGLLSRLLGRSASAPVAPDLARRHAVDWLLKHLTVTPIRNTQMAAVTFESPDAKQASQIANAVAQAYIDFSIEQRLAATLQASQWNKNRLAELSRQITAQEKSLNDFLQRNGLITFRGVDGLQTEELGIITNKLADAREQRIAALAQYQAITKSDGSYIADLSAIPEASSHPQIQDLRIALIKAQENLAELTRVYGDKFDKVQQAKAQVAAIRAQTQVVLKEIADGIYQRYQAALKKEQQFQQALVQKKAQFSQLAEQIAEYDNLKNNLNKTRELYNAFYQRQQETQANSTYTEASATLFEPAEQPLHPSKPNKPLFLIMVAAFSGVLAVCFVVVKASLANTVDTLTQAERRLGRAPLGEIVRLADSTLTLPDMVRLSSLEPQLSESVDGLRAALLLQPHAYPLLMVSSTATGEGSSTISALLGAALAQDLPTLLIDAN
ncbi:MAG: GumC family protein, partial [Plesiomonas shigelloides]